MYNCRTIITVVLLAAVAGCMKEPMQHTDYCENLITDTLGTGDSCRIYVPSAFTPNGDGINDLFLPGAFNVDCWLLQVYDDCDELVYSNSTPGVGWNGQHAENTARTYHYRLQAVTSQHHRIGRCGEFVDLPCIPRGLRMDQFTFSDQITYDGFQMTTSEIIGSCD